jgi:hypothetical protein
LDNCFRRDGLQGRFLFINKHPQYPWPVIYKDIPSATIYFDFKEGACSGASNQKQESVKPVLPQQNQRRSNYPEAPVNRKAGPKVPYKNPPPSMPSFRPFEGADGDGISAQ